MKISFNPITIRPVNFQRINFGNYTSTPETLGEDTFEKQKKKIEDTDTYKRIEAALCANRDEEKAQKLKTQLAQSEFIQKTNETQLIEFSSQVEDRELGILFRIILNHDVPNISAMNKMLKPYRGKDGGIGKFLSHYARQGSDFNQYRDQIVQTRKTLSRYGYNIWFNNDNIDALEPADLKDWRIMPKRAGEINKKAKELEQGATIIPASELLYPPQTSDLDIIKRFFRAKDAHKILEHYKASGLDIESYLEKINEIKRVLRFNGYDAVVNGDNIHLITPEHFKQKEFTDRQATALANAILNPNNEPNLICTKHKNALVEQPTKHSSTDIAQAIVLGQRADKDEFQHVVKKYKLSPKDVGAKNIYSSNYQSKLKVKVEKDIAHFINSDQWLPEIKEGLIPNMSLHARLQFLDRFILNKTGVSQIWKQENIQEMKDILTTVYTAMPYKLIKSKQGNGTMKAYFVHKNYEVMATFNEEGKMITIGKNDIR